jgi:hypothetical protein
VPFHFNDISITYKRNHYKGGGNKVNRMCTKGYLKNKRKGKEKNTKQLNLNIENVKVQWALVSKDFLRKGDT